MAVHYSLLTPGTTTPVPGSGPTSGPQTQQPQTGANAAAADGSTNPPPPNVLPQQLPGAFILSFRDVPNTTSQNRLQSIITMATELAAQRFRSMIDRPKGISKEQFEKLPVLTLDDLKKNGSDLQCSICFEPYVADATTTKKRSLSGTCLLYTSRCV